MKLDDNFLWDIFLHFRELEHFLFPENRNRLFKFIVSEYDREWFQYTFITQFKYSYGNLIVPMGLVLIILHISSSSRSKDGNFISVIYAWFSGNLLSSGEGLYWDEKYLLKKLFFSFKFVRNFPSTKRGGIIGIFLPLQHNLIVDQYVLGMACGLFSINVKLWMKIFFPVLYNFWQS